MKKIRIIISPQKDYYAISLHNCNSINNWKDVTKRMGLCNWLAIMDMWSLTDSYINEKNSQIHFEFPISLYNFLYSKDFDKCVYKWFNKKEVEIIKYTYSARKD